MSPEEIKRQALEEFNAERNRIAVAAEIARLRIRSTRSFWHRLVDALPFTITRKTK